MFAILFVVVTCAAIAAALALAYYRIEDERDARVAPPCDELPPPGRCVLCDAPLPRRKPSAEVLYEVEHRIDAEREAIGRAFREEPDRLAHLYRA